MKSDKLDASLKILLVSMGLILLSGCTESYTSNNDDIDNLITESRQAAMDRSQVKVEELLPKMEGDDHTQYGGIAFTDPFTIPAKISGEFMELNVGLSDDNAIHPLTADPTRPEGYVKEALEAYDLQALRMIGTIGVTSEGLSALIDTGEGRIVAAYVGDYIGVNFGQIVKITEGTIEISEKYASSTEKGWITQPAFINLTVKD